MNMASPFLRRLLLPVAAIYLLCVLLLKCSTKTTRSNLQRSFEPHEPLRVPTKHPFINGSGPPFPNEVSEVSEVDLGNTLLNAGGSSSFSAFQLPPTLFGLSNCPRHPNRFTGHIRLPNLLYNISMIPRFSIPKENHKFWNPTIVALPYWSKNQYIIVNMVAPHGDPYRRNVICEANICHPTSQRSSTPRQKFCSEHDLEVLGPNGGLRCATTPIEVNVPATPAEKCEGMEQLLADIPGFHDPRLFYSGRGEPILMVASQSRYACIGLWAIDLRTVYPSIGRTFSSSPRRLGPGPLMSYPTLTELTRNPPSTRRSYEKNWVIFSPTATASYIQYELNPAHRTFAQLIGGGLTTTNLTDKTEEPCLHNTTPEEIRSGHYFAGASWHQATPALKLVLCTRSSLTCNPETSDKVFFSAIQQKHVNQFGLPVRYERYIAVWSAMPPFNMLAVSQYPILLANETNRGWTPEEAWDDVTEKERPRFQKEWGKFTYTTTIAWAWGREESDVREKGTGFLDDEVILSVGIDDEGGMYAKVKASELLQCLRICPGRI